METKSNRIYSLVPNPAKKVETFFQQWISLPEAQMVVKQELEKIDPNLANSFQSEVIDGMKSLVSALSIEDESSAIAIEEATEVGQFPPRSPKRVRRKTTEDQLDLDLIPFDQTATVSSLGEFKTKAPDTFPLLDNYRFNSPQSPPIDIEIPGEVLKLDSGVDLQKDVRHRDLFKEQCFDTELLFSSREAW